jgi:hypothetical protein
MLLHFEGGNCQEPKSFGPTFFSFSFVFSFFFGLKISSEPALHLNIRHSTQGGGFSTCPLNN